MGLDMYLTKKIYLGLSFEHNQKGNSKNIIINDKEYPTKDLQYLEYEVAYWRKANQIHKWFVDNIQNGNDDCGNYYVEKSQLEELINLCKKDISYISNLEFSNSDEHEDFFTKEKFVYKIYKGVDASKLNLHTQGGFFFGSTDYDEYYLKQLENTVEKLEKAIQESDSGEFYYHSSW